MKTAVANVSDAPFTLDQSTNMYSSHSNISKNHKRFGEFSFFTVSLQDRSRGIARASVNIGQMKVMITLSVHILKHNRDEKNSPKQGSQRDNKEYLGWS